MDYDLINSLAFLSINHDMFNMHILPILIYLWKKVHRLLLHKCKKYKDKHIVYANTVCAKTCYLVLNYHIILLQHQKHSGSVNLFSVIDCRAIDAGWAVFENTSN